MTGNDKPRSPVWRLRSVWSWLTAPAASGQEADRKRVEEALGASEIRYRSLFDGVPVGLYRTTPAGQIIDANPALAEILGYPDRASLLAVKVADLYAEPEDRRKEQDLLEGEGVVRDFEARLRRRDGTVIWVRDSTRAVRDASGGVLYYEGSLVDITERRRLEAEVRRYTEHLEDLVAERTADLHRTTRRVEAILNSAHDAIALVRPDGAIQQTNAVFNALLGYEVEEIFGQRLTVVVEPDYVESLAESLRSVAEQRRLGRIEVVARRKGGTTFDADAALAPVVTGEDRPSSVVLSLRDISHLKEVERLKARFVADAAHDLSHPIANLKLRLYLLKQAPERLAEILPVLESQTQRLERLVEALRTLSELDRGAAVLELAPTDLNALAADVVDANRPLAERKEQSLVFEPGEDLPPVLADRFQLERVLVNLISNALEYTPEGGQIRVTGGHAGGMCTCAVRDTGMGIAPDELPHVFERFFRSDRTRKSGREGTGLGLAIALEIVEAHGGRIAVESELDRGSVFTVWLPAHAGE